MSDRSRVRRAGLVGAAAVVALAVAGGVAEASGSGGGTVTVCVKHDGGGLYKAKKCAAKDKKLSWAKQGPAGPRGATGAAGPKGATGAKGAAGAKGVPGIQGVQGIQGIQGPPGTNGSVAGYHVAQSTTPVSLTSSGSHTVKTLALPAGSFLVDAKSGVDAALVSAPTNPFIDVSCTLTDGSAKDTSGAIVPTEQVGTIWEADTTLPLQIAVTSSSATTVTLACARLGGANQSPNPDAISGVINAVQVSSISGS
jgi:hypothetical protein